MKTQYAWLALLALCRVSVAVPYEEYPGAVVRPARLLPRQSDPGDGGDDGGDEPTDPPEPADDVTITSTITVTDGEIATFTEETTIETTVTSTVTVTRTAFETTTITEDNVATATVTKEVLVTSFITLEARDIYARFPHVATTTLPGDEDIRHGLMKRDTITELTTVTIAIDGATTIFDEITNIVVRTTSVVTTSTSLITETEFDNAETTVTVTSTRVVRETIVDTTGEQTVTSAPTGNYGSTTGNPLPTDGGNDDNNDNNDDGGSSDDGGLSSGAKAGIGAGVGALALLILVVLAVLYVRRRRRDRVKPDDLTDAGGMSEVPVGPVGGGSAAPTSREGYRGTAVSSPPPAGRVSPYHTGEDYKYSPPPAGAAELRADDAPQRTEMDGTSTAKSHGVSEMYGGNPQQPGSGGQHLDPAAQHPAYRAPSAEMGGGEVYEMPAQSYR